MPSYCPESRCVYAFLLSFLTISSFPLIYAGLHDPYPNIANLSTSWANTGGEWLNTAEWMTVKPILLSTSTGGQGFLCGFYCRHESNSCLFAILIFQRVDLPELVWSANRNRPVGLNATLLLTEDGNLILADAGGAFVWSTSTAGKSVSGLKLTENGNLVLLDRNNEMVWQSFDHPTDSLVLQQKLFLGRSSSLAYLHQIGLSTDHIGAYVKSNPPQLYDSLWGSNSDFIKYDNGSFSVYYHDGLKELNMTLLVPIPATLFPQYMRLGSDGHLRVYQWDKTEWQEAVDLMARDLTECNHPLACGKYSICSAGQCLCPGASANGTFYFRPTNERRPNMGCSLITPISCQLSQYHSFLELQNTTYFTSQDDFQSADVDICKQTCLNNCSCKAVLFTHYDSVLSMGDCSLLSEVFSLQNVETFDRTYHSTMFLKVENSPIEKNVEEAGNAVEKKAGNAGIIIVSSLGALFSVFILIGAFLFLFRKRRF